MNLCSSAQHITACQCTVDGDFITHMKYGHSPAYETYKHQLHTETDRCTVCIHVQISVNNMCIRQQRDDKDQSQQCSTLKMNQNFNDTENIIDALIN